MLPLTLHAFSGIFSGTLLPAERTDVILYCPRCILRILHQRTSSRIETSRNPATIRIIQKWILPARGREHAILLNTVTTEVAGHHQNDRENLKMTR